MAVKQKDLSSITPVMASFGSDVDHVSLASHDTGSMTTRSRRNAAVNIDRTNRFDNIDKGLIPFKFSGSYENRSSLNVRDAVILCQKAYYNFSIFRHTIDLMTEFSGTKLFYTGGTKKGKEFIEAFFNKVGVKKLIDQFFREYYRSGNVFIHRFSSKLLREDFLKITKTYGAESLQGLTDEFEAIVPSRYTILNPADIQMNGNISFSAGVYHKVLTDYELERLKHPQTEEDQEVYDGLDPSIKKKLKKSTTQLTIPLDPDKITAVFYKKQDYEPFAVPMGYPVLEDINWKAEMKKMDMAITRTTQQAILLITMGSELKNGNVNVNQKAIDMMQKLFENQSVGKVLVSDYTTNAQFVVPDISSILDPKKYEVVNRDIQLGLNNILLSGDEKFANMQIKTQVFVERLKQARDAFLTDFLVPEIKKVCGILGLRKPYPIPHFEDVELKDQAIYSRIYTRLLELGILTAEEGVDAISTGRLPTPEESQESQEEFKKLKGKGFYEPIMGGPATQKDLSSEKIVSQEKIADQNMKMKESNGPSNGPAVNGKPKGANKSQVGRPAGTPSPKTSNRVGPIGASYSLSKVKENILLSQDLTMEVESKLRKTHNKRKLGKQQKEIAASIAEIIIANEDSKDWVKSVDKYIAKPVDTNQARTTEIQRIAYEHQVDDFLASILYSSKI